MVTKEILNSHPVSVLKKEISKTNIKGYSKMKKAEVVELMAKNKSKFGHIKMATKSSSAKPQPKKKKIIKKTPKEPSPKSLSPSPKKPSPSKSPSPSFKKSKLNDLERVSVKGWGRGNDFDGRGSDVFIDNKTGRVYSNKKEYDGPQDLGVNTPYGYIISISRGRGKSLMKGILMNGEYMFGLNFDLNYPYDYNFVNFKSYKLKKFGYKNIPYTGPDNLSVKIKYD